MRKFTELVFSSPAFLAPMAGYTDSAFRQTCKNFGAALMFGEFVSADGVVRKGAKTLELLRFNPVERPFGIQLFGSDPEVMAAAAQVVEEYQLDVIDLNFGCPVQKVVKRGAGAALLNDLNRMTAIAQQVVRAVATPVTAKIRSGWDHKQIILFEAAQRLEQAGIQAVTVHPRTRNMGYSGKADWSQIAQVKKLVAIPVIGNGDIWQAADALRMLAETGCDYVMVARGALGKPWIFRQIADLVSGREPVFQPSWSEWLQIVRTHLQLACQYHDETRAIREMRKHLAFYLKGRAGASKLRRSLLVQNSLQEVEFILTAFSRNEWLAADDTAAVLS